MTVTYQEEETMTNDQLTDEVEQYQGSDDVFETPEFAVPTTPPQIHNATITDVVCGHSQNKGTPFIEIQTVSKDVPTLDSRKTSITIWLPKGWEDHIGEAKFDRASLDEKERNSYIRNIANGDKTATLQRYVFNAEGVATNSKGKEFTVTGSIARKAGRNPAELGLKKATDLESYAANIRAMLQGVDVLVTLKERGGDDPAFQHQLEAKDMFSPDEYALNPKRFKNFAPAWL